MRVALIGAQGQLASDIARHWDSVGLGVSGELISLSHGDLDVTDAAQVRDVISTLRPSIVINTAAFTQVDDCEQQQGKAMLVNADGPRNLAEACREIGARLVHFSTDYVFDGSKRTPYTESDQPSPINVYGASKLAGEQIVRDVLPSNHVIIRTSGLYGSAGMSGNRLNFVEKMIGLAADNKPIRVVNDQVCTPTSTSEVARAVLNLLTSEAIGTFHLTSAGQCSWLEFASEILSIEGVKTELTPVTSGEFGAAAKRPAYSVLMSDRLEEMGMSPLPAWERSLREYLEARRPISPVAPG